MRRVPTLPTAAAVVAAVVVLCVAFTAGVAAAPDAGSVAAASDGGPTAPSVSAEACDAGDGTGLVGCWNGTHYEDSVDFAETDGLNETQLAALTDLTMARVEHVRQRPFREDVPVETVTRSEYANDTASGNGSEAFRRWNDQVWEALFVVGDETNANDEIDSVFGGAVSGFYSPSQDRIVIVVPDGESPDIDPSTLAHELLHAMQDQYHDLTDPRYVGATQDGDLAVDGVVEGEAVHVEERYAARCDANWTCAEAPESDGGGGGDGQEFNFGILQTVLQPYGDGAVYVRELRDEGGWAAVNETMNDPPASTAEVIHRNPDYEEGNVTFEDAATGGWETYADQGVGGAETAGEASMFVMFWYQSYAEPPQAPVLDPADDARENVQLHLNADGTLQTRTAYNYDHPATAGWAGDKLYPYRNGRGDAGQDGYVWETAWQTPEDAAEFEAAYHRLLDAHDATSASKGTQVVSTGGFQGAYGVERDGTRVTIVHGPGVEDVFDLRPDLRPEAEPPAGSTATETGDDTTAGTTESVERDRDTSDRESTEADETSETRDGSTSGAAPGLGVVVTVLALVTVTALLARRSRR